MKPPFEGDTCLEQWMEQTIRLHDIAAVVETGTETGATADWFSRRVDHVWTCDVCHLLDRTFLPNVQYFQGRSDQMLDEYYEQWKNKRTLFWLDAHMCPTFCALPEELAVLGKHAHPAGRLIAIHDFRVPNHPELGFDEYEELGPLSLQLVESQMPQIFDSGYLVSFNTKAAGASRGVVLFSPL